MLKIYLAGPMAGCDDNEANGWRNVCAAQLKNFCRVLSPMVRDFRRGFNREDIDKIVKGDKQDILEADIVLAYAWKPSVGTSMEIMYAWMQGKKVLAVGADLSPWILYHSFRTFKTLAEAIAWIKGNASTLCKTSSTIG